MDIADVLSFVVIEATVVRSIRRRHRLPFAVQEIQVVDLIVIKDLCLLVVEQVLGEVHDCVSWLHRELNLELSFVLISV